MKILNLYAGIGGNRKLWGDEHEIVAVENNKDDDKTCNFLDKHAKKLAVVHSKKIDEVAMKCLNKLYGFDIYISPLMSKKKKELKESVVMAKKEIKKWKTYLKECENKLLNK
jgi:hypothetical protein